MTHTTPSIAQATIKARGLPLSYKRRAVIFNNRPLLEERRPFVKLEAETRRSNSLANNQTASLRPRKAMLALLIAAHDEELVLYQTITSAIAAGMKPEHIYVVDDNSSDSTSNIAREILGKNNVTRVRRSGKGLAITKAAKRFSLVKHYRWIHIADADGGFAPDYFKVFRRELNPQYAAATGYVCSLPGGSISQYRVFEYTVGLEIHRRFQALTNTIPVIPGPTSCFRSDVFAKVNFANKSLTEDFDVTLQIHRRKLGKIQYIPKAVAYTQDPKDFHDFINQINRWNRGIMQGLRKYHIGRRASRLDVYLGYQVAQNFLFFTNYFVVLPFFAFKYHTANVIAETFLLDVILTYLITVLVSIKTRRFDILSAFPLIYLYRWVVMVVFIKAFVEVGLFGRFKTTASTWSTAERRYRPASIQ